MNKILLKFSELLNPQPTVHPLNQNCTVAIEAASNLIFLINSHINYMSLTLPVLIKSLTEDNKINPKDIQVVVGGAKEIKTEIVNGVTYRYVTHNSFDHTALIEVIEANIPGKYFCVLHDTCKAGPRFYETIKQYNPNDEFTSIDLDGWMNMGVFKRSFIFSEENYILSLKNCSKVRAMMSEKMYFRMSKGSTFENKPMRIMGEGNPYSQSVSRKTVYFHNCDLFKYLANHKERKSSIDKP